MNDGFPFYYTKGGQKKMQEQMEKAGLTGKDDGVHGHEIVKISDTYFKF